MLTAEQVSAVMRQHRIRFTNLGLLFLAMAGLVVGVQVSQTEPRAFLFLLAFECLIGLAFILIRCEHCGYPVHKRERTLFGATFPTWSVLVPRRCLRCHSPIPWWRSSGEPQLGRRENLGRSSEGPASRSNRNQAVGVLALIALANLVGGVGLALFVDRRLIWVAIVIPVAATVGILVARRS